MARSRLPHGAGRGPWREARHTATVYRSRSDIRILTIEDTIDGADVVPGWNLPLVELFDQRD